MTKSINKKEADRIKQYHFFTWLVATLVHDFKRSPPTPDTALFLTPHSSNTFKTESTHWPFETDVRAAGGTVDAHRACLDG